MESVRTFLLILGQIIDAAPNGHEGIDIYSGMGTRIVASRSGTVCRVLHGDIPGVYYGAGNGVVIDHGNGIYSHYIHMSSTAVSTGQYVQAGATIGYMGESGNADGVHLHFAIATNSNGVGGAESTMNREMSLILPYKLPMKGIHLKDT